MNKSTTKKTDNKVSRKLQLKDTLNKLYDFSMFLGTGIGAYILWFSGNTTSLKVVAVVIAFDGARHAYKLVAVVK